ncbi:response regulator transcription factor [Thermobifida halotolerans]|uniref:Response regulator transcription factor n=1 Tax=Thermobifida halotolerans TaxID=483545 RepID=A0A399G8U0_9ACTN|nr:response regulator transcription factor [Thermobifida halotolerans]UOE21592.1 response regulator transcription factor [Thermobifida halotolerans]
MPVRVLLADGQPLVRAGLRLVVESDPRLSVVGEAADVRAALSSVRRLLPDVVLTDLCLPGGGGAGLTRGALGWAAGAEQTVRVLAVASAAVPDGAVVEALRSGASGLLLRDTPAEELLRAVRVVADGSAVLSPSVTRRLLDRFAALPPDPPDAVPPGLERLTGREREVLRLLARGLSNAEIADRLVVGETTVKTHVGRVLAKLGLRDRVQAVVYAYENGLVVPGSGGR